MCRINDAWVSPLEAALIGGLIGGVLGVAGTLVTSYIGPRKLEEWREDEREKREYGPRKALLERMLRDREPIRSLEVLSHVTGTSAEECRRLLIEIGARGVVMKGHKEGWALRERYDLVERYDLNEPPEVQ
jgi:hypothetical protein